MFVVSHVASKEYGTAMVLCWHYLLARLEKWNLLIK